MASSNAGALFIILLLTISLTPLTYSSSLYRPSDPIVHLTGANFFETIRNTENAWFIEFYATWCGHCVRLAPLFRALAVDIKGWGHMIKVGAIACSDPRNTGFCRRVNISGYPTLRFFPPYLRSDGFHGVDYIGGQTMRALQRSIVDYLSTIHIIPPSWPKMEQVSSIQEVLHSPRRDARFLLAIAENPRDGMNRYTAKKLLFDLSGLPEVHILRMSTETQPTGVYAVFDSGEMYSIAEGTNRQDLRQRVLQYIHRVPETTEAITTTTAAAMVVVPTGTRGLHLQDLESSLYNTLWLEIGGKNEITGSALQAVKKYIKTLKEHFPGPIYITNFLTKLDTWLEDQRGRVSGETWVDKLESLQSQDAYVPQRLRWTGCAGSLARYRGYPCSLWQTFHALTVNALEKNLRDPHDTAVRTVLVTIREYVRHFLGCRECASHFIAMAREIESVVRRPQAGVLWLWRAHNKVNRRLAGDATEDPRHPKREFPTVAQCPTCRISHVASSGRYQGNRNETQWNEEEVMIYLRQFYGADFVIPDSLPYHVVVETTVESTPPPIFIPPGNEPHGGGIEYPTPYRPEPITRRPWTPYPHTTPTPTIPPRRTPRMWWTTRPTRPPTPQPWTPPRIRPTRATTPQPWAPPRIRPGPALTPAPTPQPQPIQWTPKWTPMIRATPDPRQRAIPTDQPAVPIRPTPGQGAAASSCQEVSTQWSPCSCSCGTGMSTRMSNQNPECKTKLETRICQLRPCNYRFVQVPRRNCGSTYRSADFLTLKHGACETTSMMQWRYCGECYGKCCYPKRSRTQEFGFVCGKKPEDRVFGYASVHIIELCECSNKCP